jgi:signal transduction histidine kinase
VGVGLGGIARRLAEVAASRGRQVEVEVQDELSTRGHAQRLERVVGHLVQNALDATDASGRVWIKLDRFGGFARIEVGDTGHGMSPDFIRDRLFKPFQTTKQTGMGIGAYESFQYVQELGGKIEVESELKVGTLVTLLLPLIEIQKESDLHSLEVS